MSWLKKLFGGGKADQPHAEEAAPEAAPVEEAPAAEAMPAEGGEEAVEQGEEDKPLS